MLVDFTITPKETSISLSWSTSEETESDYFAILNSNDGKQWTEIGRIRAQGKSDSVKTYTHEHDQPIKGENFYRLMMVDLDESFAYSRIRSIIFKAESLVLFHPNPVIDWLSIKAPDWTAVKKLSITNVVGVKVKEFSEKHLDELKDMAINFQDFPAGVYLINITDHDGMIQMEKIFKNN